MGKKIEGIAVFAILISPAFWAGLREFMQRMCS
jgi:hypothetical protein